MTREEDYVGQLDWTTIYWLCTQFSCFTFVFMIFLLHQHWPYRDMSWETLNRTCYD